MVKKILTQGFIFLMLAVIYAPMILLIVFSFTDSRTIGVWGNFSFEPYVKMIGNKSLMMALFNTVIVAISSSLIATVLGTMGAIGIFYSSRKMSGVVSAMNRIPVINAEIITAVSLTLFFVSIFGSGCMSYFTLICGHVVLSVPFVVLSVLPKLGQLDKNVYEAALDLGATPWRALFQVVIPQIFPGILSGFMLAVTMSLDDYIVTVFTKPDGIETLSTFIAEDVRIGGLTIGFRALTAVMFFIILAFVMITGVIRNRRAKKTRSVKLERIKKI